MCGILIGCQHFGGTYCLHLLFIIWLMCIYEIKSRTDHTFIQICTTADSHLHGDKLIFTDGKRLYTGNSLCLMETHR
jgi:hypothetical protein